jgi:hypothetical protein
MRLWMQFGAPETGVVPETKLLSSCLPRPIVKIARRPAPAGEDQFHAPAVSIPPRDDRQGRRTRSATRRTATARRVPRHREGQCPDFWGGVYTGGTRDKQRATSPTRPIPAAAAPAVATVLLHAAAS